MSKLSKDFLIQLMESCFSIKEVLECAGYSRCSGNNYNTFHKLIRQYNLEREYEDFVAKRKAHIIPCNKLSNEEFFTIGTVFRGTRVRDRILESNLLPYECANEKCPTRNLSNKWIDDELFYELDHINGSNRDNRLENLRFLCLYCHRKTPTYGNRNNHNYEVKLPENSFEARTSKLPRRKTEAVCLICSQTVSNYAKTCKKCVIKPVKFEVSKEELEKMINEMPMSKIGEVFGVSDNAVKKRAKKLGIELKPMRGYWAKVYAGHNPNDLE